MRLFSWAVELAMVWAVPVRRFAGKLLVFPDAVGAMLAATGFRLEGSEPVGALRAPEKRESVALAAEGLQPVFARILA
jgi:hypothetical protein